MIPKQRVNEVSDFIASGVLDSVPEGVADRRQVIDVSNPDFNILTEIQVHEIIPEGPATQHCTGAPVEIEGFQPTQPGLLFMMAAHCDTEALGGGFKVDLDLTYVGADGQTKVLHLETDNPDNVWYSNSYGPYEEKETDGLEDGSNDLALVFIPTDQTLPAEIKPLIYKPGENNQLIAQYGDSLMVPTLGVDSVHARVDMGASLTKNNGPGDRAQLDAHISQTTSGAPIIPHEHGEPIRDEEGRIYTLGPVASIAPGTGISFFTNADPKIFNEVPFLTNDGSYAPSNTLMAETKQPEAKVESFPLLKGDYDQVVHQVAQVDTVEHVPFIDQGVIETVPITDGQPIEYVETVALNDAPPVQYLETIDPLGVEPIEYLETALYEPQAHVTFDYNAPTGISGIDAVSDSLKDDDVFFSIQHTDRGFVISDASEFDAKGTHYADTTPSEDVGAVAPATLKI